MKAENESATGSAPGFTAARHEPRFKLEVEISVRTRTHGVLAGYTVDISESGISAILKIEVPLSEIVELGFMVPIGRVNIPAMVRQRDCFRYGFQFIGSGAAQEVIRSTCRQLAVEQTLLHDEAAPTTLSFLTPAAELRILSLASSLSIHLSPLPASQSSSANA